MGAHLYYSSKVVKMAARRKFTAKFKLIFIKTAEETNNHHDSMVSMVSMKNKEAEG